MNKFLVEWVEKFPWESHTQKEGFLNLVQYIRAEDCKLRDLGHPMTIDTHLLATYLIQKDHDFSEWLNKHLGVQFGLLQEQIYRLSEENRSLRGEVEELKSEVLRGPQH